MLLRTGDAFRKMAQKEQAVDVHPGKNGNFSMADAAMDQEWPRLPSRWPTAETGEGVVHAWFMHG